MENDSVPMIEKLLPLAASGADAQQLLEAAYPYFSKPLALLDELFHVIGFYAPGIRPEDCERHSDSDPVSKAEWHRTVQASEDPVIDEQSGGPFRAMCIDVRYNGINVERLTMMETSPFAEEDPGKLKQLADVLALQYAGSLSSLTSTRDLERSALMLALIRGEQPKSSLQEIMDSLSIPKSGDMRLMIFKGGTDYRLARKKLMLLFDAILAEDNGYLLCLTGENEYQEKRQEITEAVLTLKLNCGASRPFEHLDEVKSSFRQALSAIHTAVRKGIPLISYGDCLSDDLIQLCARDRDLLSFCRPEILRLAGYDAENHTDLLQTLICYLESKCNMAETSRKTYLHYNTIKYRLKLIETICGIGEISSSDLCEFLFSVRILEFLNTEKS